MIYLFDYHNINDDHKAAAEECAKLIENIIPDMASTIRERFNIIQPKKIPLETSELYNKLKDYGIEPSVQGYMVGPDGVHIPMLAICSDIIQLESFYKDLISK